MRIKTHIFRLREDKDLPYKCSEIPESCFHTSSVSRILDIINSIDGFCKSDFKQF